MLHKFIENPLVPRVKQFLSLNVATKKPKKQRQHGYEKRPTTGHLMVFTSTNYSSRNKLKS